MVFIVCEANCRNEFQMITCLHLKHWPQKSLKETLEMELYGKCLVNCYIAKKFSLECQKNCRKIILNLAIIEKNLEIKKHALI